MITSNDMPLLIQQIGVYTYVRDDLEEISETEEQAAYYQYNEVLIKCYTKAFAEQKKDDIMANPLNYNVIQINGVYVGEQR